MAVSGEKALGRSQLEAALEVLPMAAILLELGSARVTYANPAADRMAGGAFPQGREAERYHEVYVCTDVTGRRIPDHEMPGVRAARGERLSGFRMDWHLADGVRSLTVASSVVELPEGPVALVVFEDVTGPEARASAAAGVLDAVVDAVPLGVGHVDLDLRYVWVNAALAAMGGAPAARHVGRTAREVLGEDVGARLHHAMAAVRDGGEPTGLELTAHGDRRWRAHVFPVRSTAGAPLGVGLTVEDVTDRTRLWAAEREARARAEAAEARARFLARASDELSRSLDFDTTLQAVASFAVPERADWCAIDVVERGGALRRVAIAHTDPSRERMAWELSRRWPPSAEHGVLAEALRWRRAVVHPEVSEATLREVARDAEHLRMLQSFALSGAITVPLLVRGEPVGALTFAFEGGRRPEHLDVELAEELARRASTAIENARLYRDRSHIAQVLQRSLLPPRLPEVPGFEIASRYRPAGEGNEVGGDFYDVFQRAPDAWVVVMGDVCGKGPEAASLTALARWTLRASALRSGAPADVLVELDAAIQRERAGGADLGDRFMTAVCGVLGVGEGEAVRLRLASAGHPPPLVVRAGGEVEPARAHGVVLGVTDAPAFPEEVVAPAPGDAVVLYTDGVIEAGAPGRALGSEGLVRALRTVAGRPAHVLADAVEDAVLDRSGGRPRDDVAILVLRRAG